MDSAVSHSPLTPENVVLHLSVFNALHLLGGGGGGVLAQNVFNLMRRAVMNHFFFNCLSATRLWMPLLFLGCT